MMLLSTKVTTEPKYIRYILYDLLPANPALPRKQETLSQGYFNAGPASKTLAQH